MPISVVKCPRAAMAVVLAKPGRLDVNVGGKDPSDCAAAPAGLSTSRRQKRCPALAHMRGSGTDTITHVHSGRKVLLPPARR